MNKRLFSLVIVAAAALSAPGCASDGGLSQNPCDYWYAAEEACGIAGAVLPKAPADVSAQLVAEQHEAERSRAPVWVGPVCVYVAVRAKACRDGTTPPPPSDEVLRALVPAELRPVGK